MPEYYYYYPPLPQPSPEGKATELLKASLSPSQLAEYKVNYQFTVRGSRRWRRRQYIIDCRALTGNVYRRRKDGSRGLRYCGYLRGVPVADSCLAQKLIIEGDERRFLRTAFPSLLWYYGMRIVLLAVGVALGLRFLLQH